MENAKKYIYILFFLILSGCGNYAQKMIDKGYDLEKKGLYEEAIEVYTKVIAIRPDAAIAYNQRGICYYSQGQVDTAISNFQKAIELEPDYSLAYNNLGTAYFAKGEIDKAIENISFALEFNDKDVEAYKSRAIAYFNKKEYEKAQEDVKKVQELGAQVEHKFLDDLKNVTILKEKKE